VREEGVFLFVMPGLVPGIHAFFKFHHEGTKQIEGDEGE
jgi:hypothetical protein